MKTTFEPSHRLRPIAELRAIDAMHPGMISCPPETPMRTVARMMASYRVHAIVVHAHGQDDLPGGDGDGWGVVADVDLVRAALDDNVDVVTAGQVAATPALTMPSVEPLERAMQLMTDHEVTHVIVVERHSGRPIGVLSTLDVAHAVAGVA